MVTICPMLVCDGKFPDGNANTSHELTTLLSVHPKATLFSVTELMDKLVGRKQVGGGPQVIFATHPAYCALPSLLKLNVKQPSRLEEVKGPGMVLPQNPPGKFAAPFPVGFPLEICGAVIVFPSKTYKPSQVASVLKELNVTVTTSPEFVGHIVVVAFELAG